MAFFTVGQVKVERGRTLNINPYFRNKRVTFLQFLQLEAIRTGKTFTTYLAQ